ncbi:class I SAM-dependent methyltransferase [Halapricum salinum]|uniref:class I SAM-dependent methyltransferase n=1 Tax=Halapricum salinum TaxID=1457250 RepID=UPI0013758A7C|nr:class I SAM-dependent methyltransferase [Halapricum salinum]
MLRHVGSVLELRTHRPERTFGHPLSAFHDDTQARSSPVGGDRTIVCRVSPRLHQGRVHLPHCPVELDDTARVLDLGSGTGQIAVPMAQYVDCVVAMDPIEAMIEEGRRRAGNVPVTNVEWMCGSDADVEAKLGPIHLTTIGRAFHWMDQAETLERLRGVTENGGSVAILDDPEWLTQGQVLPQSAVYNVARGIFSKIFPDGTTSQKSNTRIRGTNY